MKGYGKKMGQMSMPGMGNNGRSGSGTGKSGYRSSQTQSQTPPTSATPIRQGKQQAGMT